MRWIRALRERMAAVFRRRTMDASMDEELRFHLENETEHIMRTEGLPPAAARRQAQLRFGSASGIRESVRDARGIRALESIGKDLNYAVRGMRRTPGFTLVVVLVLGLGLGLNTALYSVFRAMVLDPLPSPNAETLVAFRWVGENATSGISISYGYSRPDPDRGRTQVPMTAEIFEEFRAATRTLETVFTFAPASIARAAIGGEPLEIRAQFVSGDYFRALGETPIEGRLIDRNDDMRSAPAVAVLGEGYWRARFAGDSGILGRTITLNDVPFTVVGVAPEGSATLLGRATDSPDVSIPLSMEPAITMSDVNWLERWTWWLTVMGRARPGVTPDEVRAELAPVFERVLRAHAPDDDAPIPSLLVVDGSRGAYDPREDTMTALSILAAAFAIIFAIVSINVANMLLSRNQTRAREVAIRASIGASRVRLVRQFLTEALVLTCFGGFAALGLAHLGLVWTPIDDLEGRVLDGNVLGVTMLLVALVGTFLGVVSAFGAVWRLRVAEPGQRHDSPRASRRVIGKSMVVAQVALSLVLLVGAGLLLGTLYNLQSVPTGFNPDRLILLDARGNLTGTGTAPQSLLERLRNLPGVESVAVSTDALFGTGQVGYGLTLNGYDDEPSFPIARFWVGSSFLETYEIPIRRGRTFDARDEGFGPPAAIINETFARELSGHLRTDVLGFRLPMLNTQIEVVGISADVQYAGLRSDPPRMIYIVDPERLDRLTRFLIRTEGDTEPLMESVVEVTREVGRSDVLPLVTTQRAEIARTYDTERLYAAASVLFAGLALGVSMIGLFGLMSYLVAQRNREIGIRMALGALRGMVLRSVLGESAILVAAGTVMGLVMAFATTHYIESLLFELEPTDPVALIAAVALLLGVSLLAAWLPARRASRVDPMVVLRDE